VRICTGLASLSFVLYGCTRFTKALRHGAHLSTAVSFGHIEHCRPPSTTLLTTFGASVNHSGARCRPGEAEVRFHQSWNRGIANRTALPMWCRSPALSALMSDPDRSQEHTWRHRVPQQIPQTDQGPQTPGVVQQYEWVVPCTAARPMRDSGIFYCPDPCSTKAKLDPGCHPPLPLVYGTVVRGVMPRLTTIVRWWLTSTLSVNSHNLEALGKSTVTTAPNLPSATPPTSASDPPPPPPCRCPPREGEENSPPPTPTILQITVRLYKFRKTLQIPRDFSTAFR